MVIIVGIVIYLVGWLAVLIAAFRESILWGVACLLLPIVQLFFIIVHWSKAKKPFFLQLLGLVVMIVAMILSPHTAHR
ncbi:MAG TPA: hypothetical protein VG347_19945 [Verrucomicrobiae bacterium]|nr:hypothetical protein [Verrucomicrobiae bacterium]